jgi:hypothetical protein
MGHGEKGRGKTDAPEYAECLVDVIPIGHRVVQVRVFITGYLLFRSFERVRAPGAGMACGIPKCARHTKGVAKQRKRNKIFQNTDGCAEPIVLPRVIRVACGGQEGGREQRHDADTVLQNECAPLVMPIGPLLPPLVCVTR